ncbi:MAG: antibiotic biosynthesis monooxygenase [Candidatus Limnocylindrales bacterium]|jgi:autoinducer 2-degrading protein
MYVTVVHIHVKPEHVEDFLGAIRVNHDESRREPGNVRFDILRSVDDPALFVTYMAYRDEASARAHTSTAHLLAFREEVADWMVVPRENVRYDGLFPADVQDAGTGGTAPPRGGPMYVTMVYVHVKPEHVSDFIESIRPNHEGSIREPGNLRFDILESVDDPTRFIAYEAYADEASAWAHKETSHYLRWRDQVAGWMAEPRQGVRYEGLFPALGSARAAG